MIGWDAPSGGCVLYCAYCTVKVVGTHIKTIEHFCSSCSYSRGIPTVKTYETNVQYVHSSMSSAWSFFVNVLCMTRLCMYVSIERTRFTNCRTSADFSLRLLLPTAARLIFALLILFIFGFIFGSFHTLSAIYRLSIGFLSALYRLCIGFLSAFYRLSIGFLSAF